MDNKEKKISKKAVSIIVALVAMIGCIILVLVLTRDIKSGLDINPEELSSNYKLSEEDKEIVSNIRASVNNLYAKTPLIYVHTGEEDTDITSVIYNKDGQCYMETQAYNEETEQYNTCVVVYLNSHVAVSFTDPVTVGFDTEFLGSVLQALKLVESGNASVSFSKYADSGITEYKIEIVGKTNIAKLYTSIDKEYGKQMMIDIFDDYVSAEDSSVDATDTTTMIFTINVGENEELGMSCGVTIDSTEYVSWWFDGYCELGQDWSIDESTWNVDKTSSDYWIGKITDVQNQLDPIITTYKEELQQESSENTISEYDGYTDEQIEEIRAYEKKLEESNEAYRKKVEAGKEERLSNPETAYSLSEEEKSEMTDEEIEYANKYLEALRKSDNGEELTVEEEIMLNTLYISPEENEALEKQQMEDASKGVSEE